MRTEWRGDRNGGFDFDLVFFFLALCRLAFGPLHFFVKRYMSGALFVFGLSGVERRKKMRYIKFTFKTHTETWNPHLIPLSGAAAACSGSM